MDCGKGRLTLSLRSHGMNRRLQYGAEPGLFSHGPSSSSPAQGVSQKRTPIDACRPPLRCTRPPTLSHRRFRPALRSCRPRYRRPRATGRAKRICLGWIYSSSIITSMLSLIYGRLGRQPHTRQCRSVGACQPFTQAFVRRLAILLADLLAETLVTAAAFEEELAVSRGG